MHIVFQFPVIDARSLAASQNNKLEEPRWPAPVPLPHHRPFIRRFGAVEQRLSGGNTDWPGENYFCNAHLSMRYDNLHHQGLEVVPGIRSAIHHSYRRYFSEERFVGKIEAGFVDNTEKVMKKNAGKVKLDKVLKHYADLPVWIQQKKTKLYCAAAPLAKEYYQQSTSLKKPPADLSKYIEAGEISIVLVFTASDGIECPAKALLLQEIELPGAEGKLKLYGYKFRHDGLTLKAWLIETPVILQKLSNPSADKLRNLRINLLRIHLEKETVRVLLNAIKSRKLVIGNGSPQAAVVDAYLKVTAERLFRKERFTIRQENILDFALHSEDIVSPGSFEMLEEEIHYFSDQYTRQNIERLIGGMAAKKILMICASPKGTSQLSFGKEYKKIKDKWKQHAAIKNYSIEFEPAVKRSEFKMLLKDNKPDYLHLSMHSTLKEGLYFEDEKGNISPMSVADFAKVLAEHKKENEHQPTVVLLSACNSQQHALAIKDLCKFSIGTRLVFPADAGIIYAGGFYDILFTARNADIEACHLRGTDDIQKYTPPFDPINNIPVHEILILTKN